MLMSLESLLENHNLKILGVIHVGAHHGWEYPHYAAAGIKDLVMVEPHPNNFEILEASVGEECLLFNTALGNKEGTVEFHVETDNMGQSCSILKPELHCTQYPGIKFTGTIVVPITTLDLLPLERERYNFLNMDVQGYELEVLKGGTETLKGIDAIYTEVNREEVYAGCARVEELDAFLGNLGFTRVLTDWAGGSWGDALYLRDS